MTFKGKTGVWVPFVIIFLLLFLAYGYYLNSLPTIALSSLGIIFQVLWAFPSIVTLNEKEITIRVGINKKVIEIQSIETIEKTNDPKQSFATSLDRLKIVYCSDVSVNSEIMISLKDNDAFIKELKNINPLIIYK